MVRPTIKRKHWYCRLGKCIIFTKKSQKQKHDSITRRIKILTNPANGTLIHMWKAQKKVNVMWNVIGRCQFVLAWVPSAYHCFFVEDNPFFAQTDGIFSIFVVLSCSLMSHISTLLSWWKSPCSTKSWPHILWRLIIPKTAANQLLLGEEMVPNAGNHFCLNFLSQHNNVLAHRAWKFQHFLEN